MKFILIFAAVHNILYLPPPTSCAVCRNLTRSVSPDWPGCVGLCCAGEPDNSLTRKSKVAEVYADDYGINTIKH